MEPLTSTIRYLRFPYLQIALKAVIAITFITSSFGVENKASSDWWSLQPIEEISPPEVTHKNLVKNPIDSFIIKKLKENNLEPSKIADPRTQIRRLFFDLIGLPPSPEQIRNYENNPSDEAYNKIVNELLESKHYGERWGRHWLDIARFGESDGFERNNPINNLWPFRDWVI